MTPGPETRSGPIIGDGVETLLEGTEGQDLILGSGIGKTLPGLGGGDVLDGGGGDDLVDPGANDFFSTGAFDEIVM
jgi:hypothetical protein